MCVLYFSQNGHSDVSNTQCADSTSPEHLQSIASYKHLTGVVHKMCAFHQAVVGLLEE